MKSLALERFKLFSKLGIEKEVSYSKGEIWTASWTEGKIFMLDQTFWLHSTLPGMEESILFYISGNVAFKEGLALRMSLMIQTFMKIQNFCYYCDWWNIKMLRKLATIIYLLVLIKFMKVANCNIGHINVF